METEGKSTRGHEVLVRVAAFIAAATAILGVPYAAYRWYVNRVDVAYAKGAGALRPGTNRWFESSGYPARQVLAAALKGEKQSAYLIEELKKTGGVQAIESAFVEPMVDKLEIEISNPSGEVLSGVRLRVYMDRIRDCSAYMQFLTQRELGAFMIEMNRVEADSDATSMYTDLPPLPDIPPDGAVRLELYGRLSGGSGSFSKDVIVSLPGKRISLHSIEPTSQTPLVALARTLGDSPELFIFPTVLLGLLVYWSYQVLHVQLVLKEAPKKSGD